MIVLRVLGLVVATGFCACAALALRRALGLAGGAAGVVVGLVFFTTIQSLLVVAAGLTGTLSAGPLTLVTGVGLALVWRHTPPFTLRLHLPDTWSGRILPAMAAAALLSLLLKTALLAPYHFDALSYHLPKVAEWIQAGRFVWDVNHDPRSWFPAGFELIDTWWVVFLRHDAVIELGGVQMALLAGAAVYTLAEALGAHPGLAAVTYLFVPIVLLHATSCGNDLAVAALTLASYALIAARAPRPVQALPLLLAIGVKATGAFAAPGVVLFALVGARPPGLSRRTGAVLVGAGLFLATFWYARNFVVAGNPLYPFDPVAGSPGLFVGSYEEFAWTPGQGRLNLDSLVSALRALPRRLLDRHPYESLSYGATGWGWAMLPLGAPALLLALRDDARLRVLALCFAIGACLTLAAVHDDGMQYRLFMWLPALLALSLARQRGTPWMTAALLACVINFVATLVPYELRHYRHARPPAVLAPTEPIACIFQYTAPCYRLYNADFSRRVFYPRSMEELRASGARYVYLSEQPDWTRPMRRWPAVAMKFRAVR